MSIKVRFAPSPTGYLHVGNIRIAIFNYLFSKKNNGSFVLRIDDTDIERSKKEFEKLMLVDLAWLGIQWNEFYRQSNRIADYDAVFEYLKSIARVYPCYENKDELTLKKKIQSSKGVPPIYDRAALKLSPADIEKFENEGRKPYWRFKLNQDETISWNDLVHKNISIPLNSMSDPVVIKPNGDYVYTFASVVDDINIGISHIIRGDDHITNTAVQIDLFRAISNKSPQFAHFPLMSSIDGTDVSKRNGSPLSIVNMRKNGLEPQAIVNLLANIGTANNPIYSDNIDDLIEKFSFDKMSLSVCKFDITDIERMTKKIICDKSFFDVKNELLFILSQKLKFNLEELSAIDIVKYEQFWNVIKENINILADAEKWCDMLFDAKNCHNIKGIKEDEEFVQKMLNCLTDPFDFDIWINNIKKATNRKGRELFHPIRVVLTGIENGPELKKITDFIGLESIKSRIQSNLKMK